MVGFSNTDNENTQIANANIAQQYSGTCQIRCDNKISGSSINIINSQVGGDVGIEQTCSVNGQCMFNNNQSALADIFFKAANSGNAQSVQNIWQGNLAAIANVSNISYQNMNENIVQNINQKCDVESVNDISDSTIYAINSQIGGKVVIGQEGQATGNCTLMSGMNATAKAMGLSDNCAAAGKKAKKACGGKGGGIGTYILYGIIGLVIFVAIMLVVRYFRGQQLPDCTPDLIAKGTKCKPLAPAPVQVSAPVTPTAPVAQGEYQLDATPGAFTV